MNTPVKLMLSSLLVALMPLTPIAGWKVYEMLGPIYAAAGMNDNMGGTLAGLCGFLAFFGTCFCAILGIIWIWERRIP